MSVKRRNFQMAEQIQELIAWELQRVSDPRLHLVTVTACMLSPDMRHAKVYWMVTGGKDRIEEVDEGFKSAAGLFKHALAKKLKIKFIPELHFHYDDTLDVTEDVMKLIEKAKAKGDAF